MRRRGIILVSVMIVTVLAGMVAAGLLFRMRAAMSASAATDNGEQAYQAAMSGVRRAITILTSDMSSMDDWYDNPEMFRNQKVCQDGMNTWYFTIYAADAIDATKVRYGLVDEAGKIHINMATRGQLQAIGILDEEAIDCLLDYLDADDDQQGQGAEQEYYDRLPFPYLIKNGPIATVEELLLVKTFNGSIVYGEDANLNGLLEANENDHDETFPPDDGDGLLNCGMRGLATTLSYEGSFDNDGQPRLNINDTSVEELLEAGIGRDTVRFIDLWRNDGRSFNHPVDLLGATLRLSQDREDYDGELVLADTEIESPVGGDQLAIILDKLVAGRGGMANIKYGLINVNTAAAEVLASVEGIDQAAAQSIVATRTGLDGSAKSTIAWLYTQAILDEKNFKAAARQTTARSYQYRIQSIGFGVPCGRIRVLEVLVDLGRGLPRIRYLRDITRLGIPFALTVEAEETSEL